MIKIIIKFFKKNGIKKFRYLKKRIFRLIPVYIWSKRFKKCGCNFYLEKPINIPNPKYIEAGNRFHVYFGARIECIDKYGDQKFCPKLIIGNNVTVNNFVHIGVINKVIIEDNVLLASGIYISDHNHGNYSGDVHTDPQIPPSRRSLVSPGMVKIKENAWIGENVTILPNVTIGKGAIIGANSVVSKSIPDYSIAVGTPAKVIKRYDQKIKKWIIVNEEN